MGVILSFVTIVGIAAIVFFGITGILQWLVNDAFEFMGIDIWLSYWQMAQIYIIFWLLTGGSAIAATSRK